MKTIKPLVFVWLFFVTSAPYGDSGNFPTGILKTKDFVILLGNGPNGPVYSIRDHEGAEVAADLTEDQLASRFPGLKELVESGMADDASLSPRFKEPESALGVGPARSNM